MRQSSILFVGIILLVLLWATVAVTTMGLRDRIQFLEAENEFLKEQVLVFQQTPETFEDRRHERLKTRVFSSYPTNQRSVLVVAAGSLDGVREGMPVVSDGDVLVGVISDVGKRQSTVQTVFDGAFSLSVFIGERNERGLFVGGLSPTIELVEKEAAVASGDSVESSDQTVPLGLTVGTIVHVDTDPARAFREAIVLPSVQINKLDHVDIILDFLGV